MVFLNHGDMGNYNEALQLMPVDPDITKMPSIATSTASA